MNQALASSSNSPLPPPTPRADVFVEVTAQWLQLEPTSSSQWDPDAHEVPGLLQSLPGQRTVAWYDRLHPVHLLATDSALHACMIPQMHRPHSLFQHEGFSKLPYCPPPHMHP